jgi:16S rRNA (guanine966-N2)-methyltransferase
LDGETPLSRPSSPKNSQQNRLRIIGGKWRGRKLDFPDVEGLRPTPDRVRETLFNWLQGHVVDAHCLDLFAGSGALALEALSRGAARAVLVDNNRQATQQLEDHLRTLHCNEAVVSRLSAIDFLKRGPGGAHYNLLFLDPPFGKGLINECIPLLTAQPWLKAGSYLYLEMESSLPIPALPENWQRLREKKAGHVQYCLILVN